MVLRVPTTVSLLLFSLLSVTYCGTLEAGHATNASSTNGVVLAEAVRAVPDGEGRLRLPSSDESVVSDAVALEGEAPGEEAVKPVAEPEPDPDRSHPDSDDDDEAATKKPSHEGQEDDEKSKEQADDEDKEEEGKKEKKKKMKKHHRHGNDKGKKKKKTEEQSDEEEEEREEKTKNQIHHHTEGEFRKQHYSGMMFKE